jgi:hypothetical protein
LYTDSQAMLVPSFSIASRYYNCCTDGSTGPGNYGYLYLCAHGWELCKKYAMRWAQVPWYTCRVS